MQPGRAIVSGHRPHRRASLAARRRPTYECADRAQLTRCRSGTGWRPPPPSTAHRRAGIARSARPISATLSGTIAPAFRLFSAK
jgi:hypothetical protein